MANHQTDITRAQGEQWLKRYYFTRAAFSAVWVALAFSLGQSAPAAAAVLLVIYPAWDALANYIDLSRSGGMAANPGQTVNAWISILMTVAVLATLQVGMNWVLGAFGAWAILSGLLQLIAALRRWKRYGAQWAMVLSGAQSALAGSIFIVQAHGGMTTAISRVAGYAAVGAIYFLVSAVWLTVSQMRRRVATTA